MKTFVAASRIDAMLPEKVMARTYAALAAEQNDFVALDGGAHKAYHTKLLAALPNCRKVYAVEASELLADDLRAMNIPRTEVVCAAIQQDPACTEIVFRLSDTHPGRSGILPIWQDDASVHYTEVRAPATTIDIVCTGDMVNFIKLDLEGGEFRALQGAVKTLAYGRPWVAFENSNRARKTGSFSQQEFYDFFAANGYELLTFWGDAYTPTNEFEYWYAAAAPLEQAGRVRSTLLESVNALVPGLG